MQVKISIIDNQFVHVQISGDISVFDEQFEDFYKNIMEYSRKGMLMFFFDFTDVKYIDSSGISLLIRISKPLLDKQSMICIKTENVQVLRMLTISNLDQLVHFISSKEDALAFYKLILGFEPKK